MCSSSREGGGLGGHPACTEVCFSTLLSFRKVFESFGMLRLLSTLDSKGTPNEHRNKTFQSSGMVDA